MDRDEALRLLRGGPEGIHEWNRRRAHGEEIPDLSNANLYEADLSNANLHQVNLSSADLSYAYFRSATLSNASLHNVSLRNAYLRSVNLSQADLSYANLLHTDLSYADLRYNDLSYAYLTTADLSYANLISADLSGASLRGTVFCGSSLCSTKFMYAEFSRATLADLDFSEAQGLDQVRFGSPCSIGVDTLLKSKGEIPESFLKGCGLRDEEIEYFRATSGQPIRFYSCFISYCTKDEAFATRLHNDFQSAGVRCWKWDHDARTGEELFGEINKAIRVHDKVVLVASRHSLTSPAVNREIERAIQEEDRRSQKKAEGRWEGVPSVLFPVRLDDYIFEQNDGTPVWDHPRRADVVKKMIADAVGWEKDNAKYEKVRDRLIRDLKEESA